MMRHLRLLRLFLATSLQLELEYRVNLLINAVQSLFGFGAGLVVLAVMFAHADSFGGWSFHEALALYGIFLMVEEGIDMVLIPNLNRLPEQIRTGNLDLLLLKPVSARFQISFRTLNIWSAPGILLGLGIVLWSLAALDRLDLGNLLLMAVLLANGGVIVYSIWFALMTSAFWFVRVENASELFNAFFSAGRFPVSAFPPWVRFMLTAVVPIAFVTTVPAEAALDRLEWPMAVAGAAIAAILLFASHALWRHAIANYTSASS